MKRPPGGLVTDVGRPQSTGGCAMESVEPGGADNSEKGFPQAWIWEDDGNIDHGKFVRLTTGPTKLYGTQPIAVLEVGDEERSVWLNRFVLRQQFKEEFERRGKVELEPGEEISITWLGKVTPKGGGPPYHRFETVFHEGAGEQLEDMFELGRPSERLGESGNADMAGQYDPETAHLPEGF